MYQRAQVMCFFPFSSSSIERIQGHTYNHVILTLLHADMFSHMEEKEATWPLLQKSLCPTTWPSQMTGAREAGPVESRRWELAWLCPCLATRPLKSPISEQREWLTGMEPDTQMMPGKRFTHTPGSKWQDKKRTCARVPGSKSSPATEMVKRWTDLHSGSIV